MVKTKTRGKTKVVSKSKSNPKSKLKFPPLPKDYRKDDRFEVLGKMKRKELEIRASEYNIPFENKSSDQIRRLLFRAMLKKVKIKKDKEIGNVYAENRPTGSQIVVGDQVVGDHYDIIDYNPEPLEKVEVQDLGRTGVGIQSETPTGKKLQTIVLVRTDRELEED